MKAGRNLGVTHLGSNEYQFRVWAPDLQKVEVHLIEPQDRTISMTKDGEGYFEATLNNLEPGALYKFRLGGDLERPDPTSHFQPQGVHGPSQIVLSEFEWTDLQWSGLRLQDYLIYEIHVGTYTTEGTFESIIPYLDELRDLGITAIEIMPIAQFPGNRNWGYDGASLFAPQNSYGGPDGFKMLVNACHQRGLAVILDVVYNHLGAEGNYLADFGPYFTDRHKTPWGAAVNLDGPQSDDVRDFFIQNALYWITKFHVDALRLDATDYLMDTSAYSFLEQLADTVHDIGNHLHKRVYVIAENDTNDPRITSAPETGGFGMDAQWSDDLHHALHTLLTEENGRYYQDFGEIQHLAKAFRDGFAYAGQYSEFRKHRHGRSSRHIPASHFIVCAQNHDQVGNRMLGERLSQLTTFEGQKLAAGILLLSPYIPLLFMGQEYGDTTPFLYFADHSDPELCEAIRQGRAAEFALEGEPPDPEAEETFLHSKLNHSLKRLGHHQVLLKFYAALIQLRKTLPPLTQRDKEHMEVIAYEKAKVLFVRRWSEDTEIFFGFNFCIEKAHICLPVRAGRWRKQFDSTDECWRAGADPGAFAKPAAEYVVSDGELMMTFSPYAFFLFSRER